MASSFQHPDVIDIPGAIGAWWRDFRLAAAFLTCLPVGRRGAERVPTLPAEQPEAMAAPVAMRPALARASGFFPLVGAGIGIAGALALLAAFELGLHPLACALLAIAMTATITGALHEDGLADFADGLGGGSSREARLQIMRDARIGSFGTLALIFGVGLRAAILSGMSSSESAAAALIAAATAARAVLPAVMRWQTPARSDGLSVGAGTPGRGQVLTAALIALAVCLLFAGFWTTLVIALFVVVTAVAVCALADRTLGGQTGDVLGSVAVLAELAALAAIAATE